MYINTPDSAPRPLKTDVDNQSYSDLLFNLRFLTSSDKPSGILMTERGLI